MQEKCILGPHFTQFRSLSKPLGSLSLFGILDHRNWLLKRGWFHNRKIAATNQKLPNKTLPRLTGPKEAANQGGPYRRRSRPATASVPSERMADLSHH
jgi:hypothetical protein